ncbi:MAG TPA: alpha/beta hydrolase-fold protein [Bacteroidia bacterium]|nr:alpha/beta hydrolase-fold protein [Bacteroidia bacterium]
MTALAQKNKPAPQDGGKPLVIGEVQELLSAELGEKRTLNIYLPQSYAQNDTAKYPVIYLLDGGMDEDFLHIAGLVQFSSFPWVARVPESIVVGIVNTDRKRDFTFPTTIEEDRKKYPTAGHSDKFIAFLEKELQPFIEKKYRTTASKTIIGESLGGLLATEILLKKPALFNKYIIVSPSLWWDNGSLLKQESDIFTENFTQQTDVYIGVGKEGLTPGDPPHVMEVDANQLADRLKNSKSKSLDVCFDYLPQEDHATVMHQAVLDAFRMLYPAEDKK